jgi:hypothetical protein
MITKVLTSNGCPVGSCIVPAVADQRPGDIKNYASIRDTPLALAVVLAVLAVGTLAHVLLPACAAAAATWRCSRP